MFHYLDFLHDAAATAAQNGFQTHLLAAPLPQLQQYEHSLWIQCNPFVAAKKSQACERAFSSKVPKNIGRYSLQQNKPQEKQYVS